MVRTVTPVRTARSSTDSSAGSSAPSTTTVWTVRVAAQAVNESAHHPRRWAHGLHAPRVRGGARVGQEALEDGLGARGGEDGAVAEAGELDEGGVGQGVGGGPAVGRRGDGVVLVG